MELPSLERTEPWAPQRRRMRQHVADYLGELAPFNLPSVTSNKIEKFPTPVFVRIMAG